MMTGGRKIGDFTVGYIFSINYFHVVMLLVSGYWRAEFTAHGLRQQFLLTLKHNIMEKRVSWPIALILAAGTALGGLGAGYGWFHSAEGENIDQGYKRKVGDIIRFSAPSGPVRIGTPGSGDAEDWVLNYRKIFGKDKEYAFNVMMKDVKKFTDSSDCAGLRLYFAIKKVETQKDSTTLSLVMTGYRNAPDSADIYYYEKGVAYAVDDMTRCPPNQGCPDEGSTAARLGKMPK